MTKINLPPEFISTITNTFGKDGEHLISNLPSLIEEASIRWQLTDVQPVPMLSYNFVAFANRRGAPVVLKMSVPNREAKSEMAALRLFDGNGACRLVEADEEKCWMLLERLQPGEMLVTLDDDEQATRIAAEVMQRIWRFDYGATNTPLRSARNEFIELSDWFDGLKRLRARFDGGTGPLNEHLVVRVERSVQDFLIENHRPVLMHGDFHHFNILSSERGWRIIDPKGVIGPACYEVGPLLINPWSDLSGGKDYRGMTRRRIDILHEHLGFERQRLREWGLAHAILSAWWGIEDNTGWESALRFAEMIAELK